VEQWFENNYPSFVKIVEGPNGPRPEITASDARSLIYTAQRAKDAELAARKNGTANGTTDNMLSRHKEVAPTEVAMYIAAAFGVIVLFCGSIIWLVLTFTGETVQGYRGAPGGGQGLVEGLTEVLRGGFSAITRRPHVEL